MALERCSWREFRTFTPYDLDSNTAHNRTGRSVVRGKRLVGPYGIQVGTGVEQLAGPQHRANVVGSIVRPHPQEADWSGRDKRAKLVEIQRRRDVSLKE